MPPRVEHAGGFTIDESIARGGANVYTWVVPNGYYGMVVLFSGVFQTDATVGNRIVQLVYTEVGVTVSGVSARIPAPAPQTASETRQYTFAVDVATINPGANISMTIQIPRMAWAPGSSISFSTSILGGDLVQSTAFLRAALFPTGGDPPRPNAGAQPPAAPLLLTP